VWEGGFDEAAWGAAGGLSEFHCCGTVTGTQILKMDLSNTERLTENLFGEKNLPNHAAFCHLQNCISRFFRAFKLLMNLDSPRHTTAKKGHSDFAPDPLLRHYYMEFQ